MTEHELIGTARVLRQQQSEAYARGDSTTGLELSYRASLCEIAVRVRRGEINQVFPTKPTVNHQPTQRASRVRKYTLKQIDSEIPRGVRRATQTIISRGFTPMPAFKL